MPLYNRLRKPLNRDKVIVEPYTVLASYYSEVMLHVNYIEWAFYIKRVVKRHKKEVKTVTDLACGTGNLAYQLARQGFEVTGVDGCENMIEEAREREIPGNWSISFHIGDLTQKLPVDNQDLVLCLYDSVNYLMEIERLRAFMNSVKEALAPGGILIFDCSTEMNSIRHFDGYEDSELVDGALIFRHAYYDNKERIQNNIFEIYPNDERVMYYEHHKQRVYSIETLSRVLEQSGYELIKMYDKYTMHPGSEESDRVHFVARLK
jgi:SAM-dependent methyltransferase